MLADLHAITMPREPDAFRYEIGDENVFFFVYKYFRKSVLETTASLLACGIDPKRSLIYRQSDVRIATSVFNTIIISLLKLYHHTQLAWLLGTLTTVQKVGHNPTYKVFCFFCLFQKNKSLIFSPK
jgi:tryptophanyl-tRNA synthetase